MSTTISNTKGLSGQMIGYIDDAGQVINSSTNTCIGYFAGGYAGNKPYDLCVFHSGSQVGYIRKNGEIVDASGRTVGRVRGHSIFSKTGWEEEQVGSCNDGDIRAGAAVLLGLFNRTDSRSDHAVSNLPEFHKDPLGPDFGISDFFLLLGLIGIIAIICVIVSFFNHILIPFVQDTVNPFIDGLKAFLTQEKSIVDIFSNYVIGVVIAIIILVTSWKGGASQSLSVFEGVLLGILYGWMFGIAGENTIKLIGSYTFLGDTVNGTGNVFLKLLAGGGILFFPVPVGALFLRLGAIRKEYLRVKYARVYIPLSIVSVLLFSFLLMFTGLAETGGPVAATLLFSAISIPWVLLAILIIGIGRKKK